MKNRNYEIDKAKKLLGITKNATAQDAKNNYRDLAKIWHPDINESEEAHGRMQEINKSYALLMKEEFGILDPWEEVNRWWWRQFGNDPIWGNYFPEEESEKPKRKKEINM